MKKRRLQFYCIIGFWLVGIIGTLAHFAYDFSGKNQILAFFVPISESVWEHTKLLFFPMLLYGSFSIKILKKEYPCLLSGWLAGIISGTLLIPVLYYTYSGALGYHLLAVDILIFFLSVLTAFFLTCRLTLNCCQSEYANLSKYNTLLCILTGLLFLCYIVFTISPPKLGLFWSP